MSQQKKAVIVLVVIAVFFVGFMISGVLLDRGTRPEPNDETAEKYKDSTWASVLEKPIAMFTPSLSPESMHVLSKGPITATFAIDEDTDHSFRSLKVRVDKPEGWTKDARATVTYKAPGSSNSHLSKQEDELIAGPDDKDCCTTFAVLKGQGELSVSMKTPVRLSLVDGDNYIMICERSVSGTVKMGDKF